MFHNDTDISCILHATEHVFKLLTTDKMASTHHRHTDTIDKLNTNRNMFPTYVDFCISLSMIMAIKSQNHVLQLKMSKTVLPHTSLDFGHPIKLDDIYLSWCAHNVPLLMFIFLT